MPTMGQAASWGLGAHWAKAQLFRSWRSRARGWGRHRVTAPGDDEQSGLLEGSAVQREGDQERGCRGMTGGWQGLTEKGTLGPRQVGGEGAGRGHAWARSAEGAADWSRWRRRGQTGRSLRGGGHRPFSPVGPWLSRSALGGVLWAASTVRWESAEGCSADPWFENRLQGMRS